MATNIASLAVSLVMNSADFTKKIKGATGLVTQFGVFSAAAGIKAAKFAATVTTLGTAAAAAAVGGLALLARQGSANLDMIGKVSSKLGISTKALGQLQLAAKEAAVTNQQLELGLQRMTRRVAEAASGMGEAQKALKELGLDATKLVKLSPDKIFFKLGESLRRAGTQSDKIRLAFKLFDSEGVNLIRILMKTDDEIRAIAIAADKMGLSFDNISVKQVENARDAVGRLTGTFTGIGNALALEFAPIIDDIATRLFNLGTEGDGIKEKVAGAFDAIIDKADSLISKLVDVRKNLKSIFSVAAKAAKQAPSGFTGLTMDLISHVFPEILPLLFIFRKEVAKLKVPGLITDSAPAKALKSMATVVQIGMGIRDRFAKPSADRISPIRQFVDAAEKASRAKAALQVAQEAALGLGLPKLAEKAKEEKAKRMGDVKDLGTILELRGGVGQGKLGRTFFGDRGDRQQRRQIQLLEQIAENTRTPVAVAG